MFSVPCCENWLNHSYLTETKSVWSFRVPQKGTNWAETSSHTSQTIHLPASMNACYVTHKEPWISINREVLVREGQPAKTTSGRLVQRYWLPAEMSSLLVHVQSPPLHFSGSEITLACLILSGYSLEHVWTLRLQTPSSLELQALQHSTAEQLLSYNHISH